MTDIKETELRCSACKTDKPIAEIAPSSIFWREDGTAGRAVCRECQRKRGRESAARTRAAKKKAREKAKLVKRTVLVHKDVSTEELRAEVEWMQSPPGKARRPSAEEAKAARAAAKAKAKAKAKQ